MQRGPPPRPPPMGLPLATRVGAAQMLRRPRGSAIHGRSAGFLFPVSAIRAPALPIHDQGVIADRESEALGHRGLTLLDAGIHELFDPAAVQTHDVIMVRS